MDASIHRLTGAGLPTDLLAGRVVVLPRVIVQDDDPAASVSFVERIRSAGALAVVFEIDDDEISDAADAHHRAMGGVSEADLARLARERGWIRNMIGAVDAVTVSTEPLAEVARRYTDRPVYVIPNAIDADWFRSRLPARAPWSEHLTIGWAGYRRPEADLEPMAVAWGRIARRYPDIRFVVAGWQAECIYRSVESLDSIIRVPWTNDLDKYPSGLKVDIGCCSVDDSLFSRCKSPIKAWEYAVAGAAVVATPALYGAGANYGAFMAQTADDWEEQLSLLIERPEARKVGNGRLSQYVLRDHSLETQLWRWPLTYQQIVGAREGARA